MEIIEATELIVFYEESNKYLQPSPTQIVT